MKFLKTGTLVLLFSIACLPAVAQKNTPPVNEPDYNKPKIFSDLPQKLALRLTDAEALLNLPVGAQVSATLAKGFLVTGVVVSKSNPTDPVVQSVVIKSTNRQNATFTFTRIKNTNGSFSYQGRMMGKSAGDALELVKDGDAYVFRKTGYYDLINE